MLIVFHGNDEVKTRAAARERAAVLSQKQNAGMEVIENENFSTQFEQSFFVQSFFEPQNVVLGLQIYDKAENKKYLEDNLINIVEQNNILVLAEKKLLAADIKRLEKVGVEVKEIVSDKKGEFNIFKMTDCLGQRDKKNLWLKLTEAKRQNVTAENLCGVLLWQLKNILLATEYKTAAEAGLSPFPFNKAKSFEKKWQVELIREKIINLTKLYHDAHMGKVDFWNGLELFCLEV
jgi:hypothetical protein